MECPYLGGQWCLRVVLRGSKGVIFFITLLLKRSCNVLSDSIVAHEHVQMPY